MNSKCYLKYVEDKWYIYVNNELKLIVMINLLIIHAMLC